jgi:two-component system phosphate regulon sensor histidine kinase PhoR
VDASGRILDANLRARETFPFLVSGMSVLEAFGNHELAAGVAGALRGMSPATFDTRLFTEGRHTYRVGVKPYEIDGVGEALVFMADRTDFVAYQELRSQFVANVSHELRTPLTGLRGMLEAIEDPEMDVTTRARFAARARHETERLEALITDILFLSELEAEQGIPSGEVTDLSSAARTAADLLGDQASLAGVTLAVQAPGPAWVPLTDRMARTVVQNLLENAVRYAGSGAIATATVAVTGDRVTVAVADDGAGIPEVHLAHIFERFYRADPSRSKELGGTGLGLSIVKHIAERFGGFVEARSREGFGTTVTVTLPIAPPPREPDPDQGAG